MVDTGYYEEKDLKALGLKSYGNNVRISKDARIIGPQNVEIKNNVRIDGFTIIAASNGYLKLDNFIHIGSYCFLACGSGIHMKNFSGLSQGVKIYTMTDDYSGEALTNPTVPDDFKNIFSGSVTLDKHVIIGTSSSIMPNLSIGEGSSVGAHSLVTKTLEPWGVYLGTPARKIKNRSKKLLELEKKLNIG